MVDFLSFDWLGWMLGAIFLYWLAPFDYRKFVLSFFTCAFLFFHSPLSVFVLTVITCVSYFLSTTRPETPWKPLSAGLIVILVMVYFKLQISFSEFAAVLPENISTTLIPLGLSYYSFRALHFLIERYRGNLALGSFSDYVSYMFFLPTISVGPIHRAPAFLNDPAAGQWNMDFISDGLQRIVYGYAKISILAVFLLPRIMNRLRSYFPAADGSMDIYLEMVEQGLSLYILFSGYSDIAIGFALILGYRVIENFNYPYLQSNVADFWRCWHISLTSWTRDYVYMPMLASTRNPRVAVVSTFLVIGLWHEISIQFVLWGLWHALGIIVWQEYSKVKRKLFRVIGFKPDPGGIAASVGKWLGVLLTVHYFFASMIIVRSSGVQEAIDKFTTLLFFWW